MAAPGFWDDPEQARAAIQEANALKRWLEPYDRLSARVRSLLEMEELLAAEPDAAMTAEMERELDALEKCGTLAVQVKDTPSARRAARRSAATGGRDRCQP